MSRLTCEFLAKRDVNNDNILMFFAEIGMEL